MYNTDFYKLKDNDELEFMYSMSGSDCPSYYEKIKSWKDVQRVFNEISGERTVWMNWPCVWKTSKTSDDCIIFEEIKRKWYELWKPRFAVKAWVGVHYQKREGEFKNDDTKMWFSDIPRGAHQEEGVFEYVWKTDHLRLFTLPIMK